MTDTITNAPKETLTAIIPIAGKGTRMAPITHKLHKSLIPLNGITLLQRAIQSLKLLEVDKIIIVTGYLKEQVNNFIQENFSNENLKIIIQEQYLGLPHAIKIASPYIPGNFLVYCPDNLYGRRNDIIDSENIFNEFKPVFLQFTTVVPSKQKGRFIYHTKDFKNIKLNAYLNKTKNITNKGLPLFTAGITIFSNKALTYLPKSFSTKNEYKMSMFLSEIARNNPFILYVLKGLRHDITNTKDIAIYNNQIPEQKTGIQGVSIILLNYNNEILLQERDDNNSIKYPGYWGLFGGSTNPGEKPFEAIRREIQEEINYKMKNLGLFRIFTQNKKQEYAFIGEIDADLSELNLQEGKNFGFFNFNKISSLKIRPDDLETINKYIKILERNEL